MADTYIDYDAKVQNALRSVVRTVLEETAKDGLMGDHHFYVAFKTQAEGVSIPAHLVSRFPDEMTIVVQHKFWGLEVYDDHFEIGLSFNQKPETLVIPFQAIVGFVDPSVQFALQFHDETDDLDDDDSMDGLGDALSTDSTVESMNAALPGATERRETANNPNNPNSLRQQGTPEPKDANGENVESDTASSDTSGGDNIVTLDAFRRK